MRLSGWLPNHENHGKKTGAFPSLSMMSAATSKQGASAPDADLEPSPKTSLHGSALIGSIRSFMLID
jgi:hypothetical protein